MAKVLLTGTYCSFNKGDAAMELAAARAILKHIPGSEVIISSPFPRYDKDFYAPIPVVRCSRRRLILATLKVFRLLLWRGLKFGLDINLGALVNNDELQHFLSSNVIVDLSGDMLTEDYGIHVAYSHYLPLLMALAANKPYILCAQSIGPFRWTKFLARYLINRARAVTIRDSITRAYLKDLGLPESKIKTTADMAFLLEPCTDRRIDEILRQESIDFTGKRIFGISLSTLVATKYNKSSSRRNSPAFVDFISEEIAGVCRQHRLTPLFVGHVTGPGPKKDDRVICQQVAERVRSLINGDCLLLRGDYKPDELKGIISRCFLFAGARMHANIAALSSAIPVLAISYSHKTPGIMQMFSQGACVREVENLDSLSFRVGIENLIDNHDSITRLLKEKNIRVKALAEMNIGIIRQSLS